MQATQQLQDMWSGINNEMITILTNSMNRAGLIVPNPVMIMSDLGDNYKSKGFEIDGTRFKLPMTDEKRAELRNALVKRAKIDYEPESVLRPKNCGSAQLIAHNN